MNNKEVLDLINVLTTFKLNKLDDDVANIVLNNIAKIVPYNEAFVKIQEQLKKFTIETIDRERLVAFETERTRILSLNKEEKSLAEKIFTVEYKDVFEQQNRLVKALNNYLLKDVDIEFEKVDYKTFIKNAKHLGVDIIYGDLLLLKPIFDNFETTSIEVSDNDIKELLK